MSAAAFLAATACDRGPTQLGDKGADAVAPKDVSAEDLKAAVKDPRVQRFYEARSWKAAWNEDQARELTEALQDAPRHGLEATKFLKQTDVAGSAAAREAALSLAAISFADALANGQIDPRKVAEIYELPMPRVDVAKGLEEAVQDGGVSTWLGTLAPKDAEYQALSEAFLNYSRAAKEKVAAIPAGKAIKPGGKDERIPAIAAALQRNGYLQATQPEPEGQGTAPKQAVAANGYTPELLNAVKKLQADYGEDADGVIGVSTLTKLNTAAAERAMILALNLERRRWLARDVPGTRIDVNTAAAFLKYYRDGEMADTRRVVVGQPEWETPELGSPMKRLVANPPWNVPESIEQDELAAKGEAYLARNNFVRKDGRLVQQPGPDTALGIVKFDLDNKHAIYLHDTPAKALFATNDRHSSHGCVRVHNAVQFARMIAGHNGKLAEFDKGLASKKETTVELPKEIPVRLLYHTAYVDGGRVLFRDDPYGWDEKLARALGLMTGERVKRIRTHVSVTGP